MKKYISCLLVLLALLLPMLVMEAQAATTGTCGENVTWSLDSKGTLTISGTGDMADYDSGSAPWYGQRTKIKSVVIENGVTGIGEYAFYGCVKMTSITIADSVTQVEYCAFENCNGLTNVYITDIAAWLNLNNWSRLLTGNELEKKLYLDGELLTDLVIPEGVTEIGYEAFYNCSSLKSVTIPQGVTEIDSKAFYNCGGLESVTIPDSVTYIGEDAFRGCTDLTDVYITDITAWVSIIFYVDSYEYNNANPLSVGDSGAKLHLNGKIVTNLVIPKAVTTIGDYAFNGCRSLKSVTIPDGVVEIGEDAFSDCSSLEKVTIPDSVSVIADGAFGGCSSLKSVTIPEGVIEIGEYAFSNCTSLEKVTIPDSVSVIADGAFRSCSSLKSVTIPDSVTLIGEYAFSSCSSLVSITIPDSVNEIGEGAFCDCSSLESVTLPDSVTTIDNYTFAYCSSMESITIPEGVIGIYWNVFEGCSSLVSITIPESVAGVGSCAFEDCYSLTTVHYGGTEAQRADITIDGYGNWDLTGANWHYECDGTSCPNPFEDVFEGDYYCDPVLWAVNNGITNGLSENTFGPAETCTRGQIVTFLQRACDRWPDIEIYDIPFWDVTWDDYFCYSVLWAVENGITSGMGDGSFAPGAPCTRGQVATFLWRSQGQPSVNGENIFTDIAPGAYYYDAVLWAVENGITNGMGDGTFAPDAPCTRGQIVTFLYRAMA